MKKIYQLGFVFALLHISITVASQVKYASSVIAFSSQYSATDWSASRATGAPDVSDCQRNGNAWAPALGDNQREFLELGFSDPSPVNRIVIHEVYGTGAIDTVYVFNPGTQAYEKVYETTASGASCPRVLTINFPKTAFPVSKVRIALNSPALFDWHYIDAVGVASISDAGVISTDQHVCGSTQAAPFANVEPAFAGNPAVIYQWQDSTENGSWQNINGAQATTYQAPVINVNTWYRRKATLNTSTAYSNAVKLTFISVSDPSVFPVNAWNFYAYQANSLDLTGAAYRGYYSRTALNFITYQDWSSDLSPDKASGYVGCSVAPSSFVLAAKRKGFPLGNYLLKISEARGLLRVLVNGTIVNSSTCCAQTISLGALNSNSEIEIRLLDYETYTYVNAEFIISDLMGGDIGNPQNICVGDVPAGLINQVAAYGGAAPASITYQWQDSVENGNWKNIINAISLTYQPGAVNGTTWFRRKAMDNTNAFAYSDEIKISTASTQGDTAVYGQQSWNFYAFNGNQISLAGVSYRGYYTTTGLLLNTRDKWLFHESPSSASNWLGCPVSLDNFVLSGRRIGFPPGNYQLNITAADDQLMVIVNGVEKYNGACCNNINLGPLDANSKVEIRLLEGFGNANFAAEFIRTEFSIADYPNSTACFDYSLSGVQGNQRFDLTDNTGKILASINPNGNNLGTVRVSAKHSGLGTANIPVNPLNNRRYLPRYFNFTSTTYPNGNFPTPVSLRLYYKNSELDDYKTVTGQLSITRDDLRIAHYNGVTEDCNLTNNANQGVLLGTPDAREFTAAGFYLEVNTPGFSEFGVMGGSLLLPVTMVEFKAKVVNRQVQLSWTTSQELINKGFEVLRSTDGQHFEKIGWVDGNGTTSALSRYVFTDKTPLPGKNHYRLQQVDLNGQSRLTDIVTADAGKVAGLSIAPNPATETLYITCDVANIASLKIMDVHGRMVWKYNGGKSGSVIPVPVINFTQGMYLLEMVDKQGNRLTGKFIRK